MLPWLGLAARAALAAGIVAAAHASTWTGTGITGSRYSVSGNGVLYINSATPDTYLTRAGSTSGSTGNGGVVY